MSTSERNKDQSTAPQTELKAEQALGLIGLGLMKKISQNNGAGWDWSLEEDGGTANFQVLRDRLELTSLAIETGAPLSTAEVTKLLGARPGSEKTERGGLLARRLSRNVWKLSRSEKGERGDSYWRN